MKILFLTRYGRKGASSRLRTLQYIASFESLGWKCDVSSLLSDAYVHALYSRKSRIIHALSGYLSRLSVLSKLHRYDLVWIEKEIFPFCPATLERLLSKWGVRYVVDFDDAWFHRYDSHPSKFVRLLLRNKIDAVMCNASLVIAGNDYLADRARRAGAKWIEIIPTVVDSTRYAVTEKAHGPVVLGWIGSPSTASYLRAIEGPLAAVQRKTGAVVRLVGSGPIQLEAVKTEIVGWDEETETDHIASFDVGMMPLPDAPWERGKCGYKLIQYMACGRPVIASPVGINVRIVRPDENGILAETAQDWEAGLDRLIADEVLRTEMGRRGRRLVEQTYSLQAQASKLAVLLEKVVRT